VQVTCYPQRSAAFKSQIIHPALPHPRIQHGNKKERSDNESILLLFSFERKVKKNILKKIKKIK